MTEKTPTVRAWWVACPVLNRFIQAEVVNRSSTPGPDSRVYLNINGKPLDVKAADYERAAEYHARAHEVQLEDFRKAARSRTLGTLTFWAVYAWGYFRHGWQRNPLEWEARLAEDAAFNETERPAR